MVASPTEGGIYAVSFILLVASSGFVALRCIARHIRAALHRALKSGVVAFYHRILIGDRFRKVSLATLVFIALWTTAFFFATVLECNGHNLNLIWISLSTFKGQCQKYKTIQLSHCATDVATDLVVLSLPLPPIWKLNMPVQRKAFLTLLFLLLIVGSGSVAAGTARLAIVAEDIVETSPGSHDVLGTETNVLVWAYVEVGVAVIAACLPTLNQLLDTRCIGSVVASLRSKVSLVFYASKNSQLSKNSIIGGSSGLELHPTEASGPSHKDRQIDGGDSIHKTHQQAAMMVTPQFTALAIGGVFDCKTDKSASAPHTHRSRIDPSMEQASLTMRLECQPYEFLATHQSNSIVAVIHWVLLLSTSYIKSRDRLVGASMGYDSRVKGACLDKTAAEAISWINVVFDVALLVVPQFVIWRLELWTWEKADVPLVFAVGVLEVDSWYSAAIFRLVVTQAYRNFPLFCAVGMQKYGSNASSIGPGREARTGSSKRYQNLDRRVSYRLIPLMPPQHGVPLWSTVRVRVDRRDPSGCTGRLRQRHRRGRPTASTVLGSRKLG
ncbi:hypothetical protein F5Y12DRAFT_717187 [Xylaria sp. FL1777]|nr:hypothetical protein F5Y12DRAFT_717187 [Xylaria sp. FL1777]